MAQDEDAWRRLRRREDEADAAKEISKEIKKGTGTDKASIKAMANGGSEKLDELIQRADPLINQLNNLYKMFAVGVESIPPNERRQHLDQLMAALQMINKPTPAALYKYNAINSKYMAHRDLWDKMMRDLESGKIKRIAGPRRNRAS